MVQLFPGEFKGTGVPGAPVTPSQLAELQRIVDSINSLFVSSVMTGRRISIERARALADGRVHTVEAAEHLALIDGISTREVALAELAAGTVRTRFLPAGMKALEAPAIRSVAAPAAPVAEAPKVATPAPAKAKPPAPAAPYGVSSSGRVLTRWDRVVAKPSRALRTGCRSGPREAG